MAKSQTIVRKLFSLPEHEDVLDDFSWALKKKIMVHGRLFCTDNFICFYSNILGFKTKLIIPFEDITQIQKLKASRFVKNSIEIQCKDRRYLFSSFLRGNEAYQFLRNLWRNSGFYNDTNEDGEVWSDNEDAPETENADESIEFLPKEEVGEDFETLKVILPIPVQKFFDMFIADNAVFGLEKYRAIAGDTDIELGNWGENEELGGYTREFKFRFKVPPPSVGASHSRCVRVQRYEYKEENKLFFASSSRALDVPYGTYFTVEDEWNISEFTPEKCLLRCTVKVVFSKSTIFKRAVISRTKTDVTKDMESWLKEAEKKINRDSAKENGKKERAPPPQVERYEEVNLSELNRTRKTKSMKEKKKWMALLAFIVLVAAYTQYLKIQLDWYVNNCTCPET